MTRNLRLLAFVLVAILIPGIAVADASASTATASSGGASFDGSSTDTRKPVVPGRKGRIRNGVAYAPASAPAAVKKVIWAANKIRRKPYKWGGGHGRWYDTGYDCSGTVSFALRGARLVSTPLDSSSFMSWRSPGKGKWITVYTNPGHAYMVVAGLRLDTSSAYERGPRQRGPRWRKAARPSDGFTARHPAGL